ncbi:MAG: DUF885 family protein [Hyphomonadaceae bacterium]|nr:DUF885 family protein [Hyphomonadaceae bacterium]
MWKTLGAVALSALVLGLGGCNTDATREKARVAAVAELKTLMDDTATMALKFSPEGATQLAVSEEIAGGRFANRLSDASPEGLAAQAAEIKALIARYEAIDRAVLTGQDALSHDVALTALKNADAGTGFGYGNFGFGGAPTPYVVSQLTGAYTYVPDFLDSQHPMKTLQDAEDYLARLDAFATVLDQETARMQADAAKGVVPPTYVIDRTLEQMRPMASAAPPATTLVRSIQRRAPAAEGVTPAQAADLTRRAITAVRDRVQPALRRQMAAVEALKPQSTADAGAWKLPDGENYYRVALTGWTTSTLTPDEIHQMGLDIIAQTTKEMDEVLKAQGLTEGTVGARIQQLSATPAQLYPNTEAGKAQLLQDLQGQVDAMQARLPEQFGVLPKAKVEIKRVPVEIEAGAPGGYYNVPALDGSRPGYYYINLRNTAEWPRFTLPTLTYHEASPGHHFQLALSQESPGLPLLRSAILGFSGYSEGWGLYAEQLADEMGVYKDRPVDRLGYLQSMAFRAARLVVDTGLHHKKWTREQAIDYMVSVTGDQRSSIQTEVERYIVWPGQACAYMVGRQTINRLRDRARTELAGDYDQRAFHDKILLDGGTPLSVLESNIGAWIAEKKPK